MKQSQRIFQFHITNDVENSSLRLAPRKEPRPESMFRSAGGPIAPHRAKAVFQAGQLYKAMLCWKLVEKYLQEIFSLVFMA